MNQVIRRLLPLLFLLLASCLTGVETIPVLRMEGEITSVSYTNLQSREAIAELMVTEDSGRSVLFSVSASTELVSRKIGQLVLPITLEQLILGSRVWIFDTGALIDTFPQRGYAVRIEQISP
jgi:hypothetical protein